MSTLQSVLNSMRAAALAEQSAQWEHSRATWEHEHAAHRARRKALTSLMRPAQKWEYEAWLTGWMAAGGKPPHFYEGPMRTDDWWVALADMVILPLYGALAIHVIVPAGITVTGATGHSDLYVTTAEGEFLHQGFHESRPSNRCSFVPVWTDTEVTA